MRITVGLLAVLNGLKVEGLEHQVKEGVGERHEDRRL